MPNPYRLSRVPAGAVPSLGSLQVGTPYTDLFDALVAAVDSAASGLPYIYLREGRYLDPGEVRLFYRKMTTERVIAAA